MGYFHFSIYGVISLSFALFLLMDPVGNVPMFLAVLKEIPPRRQKIIIIRELLIALVIILFFAYLGEFLLSILNITQPTLLISGGIILFIIALRMIFPPTTEGNPYIAKGKEPLIVPLAIPFVAGPAVLAAVMIYSHHVETSWMLILAIILAWIVSASVLICSPFLQRLLGDKGLTACERLMGLILTLISVQMFLEGIHLFQHQTKFNL